MTLSFRKEILHESMEREEIIRYFDVDHHSKVPEYEISAVERHMSKKNTSDSQQIYKLSAFQRNLHLHLTANDRVVSPNLAVETRTMSGDLTLERYTPPGVFYHGHVSGDPGSIVAVRDTDGNGKLSGSIVSDGHLYKIQHLHPKYTAGKSKRAHVISRRSLKSLRTGAVKSFIQDSITVSQSVTYDKKPARTRREDSSPLPNNETKYVEVMMTADNFTTGFYGEQTKDYILGLANLVSRLYQDQTLKNVIDVRYVLVKMYLISGTEPELDVNKYNIRSASAYLGLFAQFAKKRNPEVGNDHHWDNAVFITRKICGLANCYLDGLAYYGVPCSSTAGVNINDAHSLGAAFSVAHELAHNFGVGHDYKYCQGGAIMSATQNMGKRAYHWSNCSATAMATIMRRQRVTCYNNVPKKRVEVPDVLPGYTWDGTQQCQFMYDKNHRLCWMTTGDCGTLFCTTGNHCYGRGVPPAEGMRCGFRKWCIKGRCVPDGTTDPPPIDGNWGSWTGFSQCSRSCGVGVQFMRRRCDNPAPQYGGKKCEGPSIGHYRTCSKWDCRRDVPHTFRDEQCTSKKAYIDTDNPCVKWCITGNTRASSYHRVKDGTKCSANIFDDNICVGGKCKRVGCDKRYGSEVVRDRCRICGKDGSMCKLVKGNSNAIPRGKWLDLHVFPEGATNIQVKEHNARYILANLKYASDKGYKNMFFHFNGPHVKKAAGTTIRYTFTGFTNVEIIQTPGPITEPLTLSLWKHIPATPHVEWRYYAPSLSSKPKATFEWSFEKGKDCSKTCAGGTSIRILTCNRVEPDDKTPVSFKYCDYDKRPNGTEPCNTQICPPVWEKGDWGKCSKRCGTGTQFRNVTCTQTVSATKTNDVKDTLCTATKPAETQDCNVLDCLPTWIPTAWLECTKPCGGGTQTRTVTCKQVKKDGSTVTSTECMAESKPETQQPCNTAAC